jgi:hypothetical protein
MTLTSLPNELIEHIASYLDLPSTHSLRLTTSLLAKASSHLFKDRFFQQHTLTWTKQSLDTFVQISLHAHYGNAIRHLVIDATPQHSMRLWQLRKKISETAPLSTPYGAVKSPEQRDLEAQHALAAKTAEETTTFFNETRYDQKMLKRAFENMSSGSLKAITFLYTGLSAAHVKGSRLYCTLSQCEMSRPFVSTMAALASSPHIRLDSIAHHRDLYHGAVSIGRMESLAPLLKAFDHAFTSLKHLALNLRDWRDPGYGFQLPSTSRAPFIVRFLAKARHIRKLELSCYSSWEHNLFVDLATHCQFDCLESCKLAVLNIPHATHLSAFLAPSLHKSLRSICLRHILLLDRDDNNDTEWADWMTSLAASQITSDNHIAPASTTTDNEDDDNKIVATRITHFCFADLFTGPSEILHIQGRRALCLDGEDWAHQLLRALDQGIEARDWRPQWDMGAFAYPFVGLSM